MPSNITEENAADNRRCRHAPTGTGLTGAWGRSVAAVVANQRLCRHGAGGDGGKNGRAVVANQCSVGTRPAGGGVYGTLLGKAALTGDNTAMSKQKSDKIVILARGLGTRMRRDDTEGPRWTGANRPWPTPASRP